MKQIFHISEPISRKYLGSGINWFDYLGTGGFYGRFSGYPLHEVIYPSTTDTDGWKKILGALDELSPSFIRYGLNPESVISSDGTIDKSATAFDRLEIIASWALAKSVPIELDTFLIPAHYEFTTHDTEVRDRFRNMAAGDNRSYARNFIAPLIHFLVRERGLSAISLFNPVNEPINYGVFQVPVDGPDVYIHYVEMFKEIREALDDLGIHEGEVGLLGIDGDIPLKYPILQFASRGVDINPYVSGYSIHSYRTRFDHMPPVEVCPDSEPLEITIDRHVRELVNYCERRGRPLLGCEVGAFYYGKVDNPAGPASEEGTLLTVETIIRMANVGVASALIWSPMNPNNIDGHWALFTLSESGIEKHLTPWNAYSAMMRVLSRGSSVYPAYSSSPKYPYQHVHGLITEKDGKIRGIFVNDSSTESAFISLQSSLLELPETLGVRTKHPRSDLLSESIISLQSQIEISPLGFIEIF